MSASQTEKGRELLLYVYSDTQGDFLPVCYATSKDLTIDSPVTGTTNQCTEGDYTDAEHTGYSTFTFNLSGNADLRPTSPSGIAYQELRNEYLRGVTRKAIRLVDAFGTIQTTTEITSFNETGAQEEHRTFTATFQVVGDDFTIDDSEIVKTGSLVAIVGTSLVGQSHDASIGARFSSTTKSWFNWAAFLNDNFFEVPVWYDDTIIAGWEPNGVPATTRGWWGYNAGVGGQTAQQIYDRRAQVASLNADVYVVDMGTNDIGGSATAQEIHALRLSMVQYLLDTYPKKVIILPILARDSAQWPQGSNEYNKYREVNQLMLDEIAPLGGVEVFDWNQPWIDQNSVEGYPRSGASVDGTHFNGASAYWVGKAFGDFMKSYVSAPPASELVGSNLLPNPTLAGTAGGNTGTSGDVADDYNFQLVSGTSTGVASKTVIGSDNVQVLDITPPNTSGESIFYLRTSPADTPHIVAGEWVRASVRISKTTVSDCIKYITVSLDDVNGGIETSAFELKNTDSYPDETFTIDIKTPYNQFNGSSPDFRWRVEIVVDDGSAVPAQVEISLPTVYQVLDPITRTGAITPTS